MDTSLSQLQDYIISYNYLLLFIVLIAETSPLGFVLPGTLVIVLSGYYAGLGELNIFVVIAVGIFGIILGDTLSFFLGKYGWIKSSFVKKHIGKLSLVTNKIKKRKNLIIVSHFPGYTRMFVPLLLGGNQFKFIQWAWRDAIGAILFVSVYSVLGFSIGALTKNIGTAVTVSKVLPLIAIVIVLGWIIVVFIKMRRSNI